MFVVLYELGPKTGRYNCKMEVTSYSLNTANVHFADNQFEPGHWAAIVGEYKQKFLSHPAQSWLLFENDSYLFAALFYALLSAKKSIILPQNAQHEHIRSVKSSVDASVGCRDISPDIVATQAVSKQSLSKIDIPLESKIYFYTSGSTGQPKVIEKSFSQLQLEVDTLEHTFAEQVSNSVFLSTVSHQHIYGLLFKLLWPIQKAHKLIANAYEYPEHITRKIVADKIDTITLIASPAHLQRLVSDNVLVEVKQNIRTIFSSGGPLDADKNLLIKQQLECTISEVYGSTETGGIAWRNRSSLEDELWQTFQGISVFYQDHSDLLKLVSPYIKSSEFLADDRVEILDANRFRLLGRADSIVKIEEKRVSLDEVRQRLLQHELVEDAYVLVVDSSRRRLAAVIVLTPSGKEASQRMRKFELDKTFKKYLSDWFEAVVVPKKFRYPTELPYDNRGKLNRNEMESSFE